ncbi:MAG: lysine--tRNA ligase, partial [Candidatus Aenigmatarchaeota archaeon]
MGNKTTFWPDKVAIELIKNFKVKKQVVTTGTSISGDPHIGNVNDVVKGHAIFLALKKLKVDSELIWVSDDMDPLRSVPKDMPKELENFLGMPVCYVPDFWGCHKNFAQHFEEKFIQQLESIFIKPKIMKGVEMYEKGMYNKVIKLAMKNKKEIVKILNKYRTSPLPEDWYPVDVICEKCGKITNTKILSYDEKKVEVEYECSEKSIFLKKKYEVKGYGYK